MVAAGAAANKFTVLNHSRSALGHLHDLGRPLGGVALTLSTHGTDQYLVQRLLSARSREGRAAQPGLVVSGLHRLRAVRAVLRSSGSISTPTISRRRFLAPLVTNDEVLPLFIVHSLSQRRGRLHRRGDRRGGVAVTVDQCDGGDDAQRLLLKYVRPDADRRTQLRACRRAATMFWGVVQSASLGRRWSGSVLDTGLAVLSLAAGSGTRRLHRRRTLMPRVNSPAMLAGMIAGLATAMFASLAVVPSSEIL